MSAPVRFLVIVVAGWTAVRAATLGVLPGFTVSYAKEPAQRELPPIAATEFPPLPPVEPQDMPVRQRAPVPAAMPYYFPYAYAPPQAAALPPLPRPQWRLPPPSDADSYYLASAGSDGWQASSLPSLAGGGQSRPLPPALSKAAQPKRFDRLQLTSWAMMRGMSVPGALSTGGTLGGSQGGARLTYRFNRWMAASLRTTTPLGGASGLELAGGIRFTPFQSIPVAITAERRQAIGKGGGRSDFALFAEGGLYRRPMPLHFDLDAYFQAGIVGIESRDLFADGALAFTRPVYGRFSAGFGLWGGVQPGLYRVDAGPRVSMRIRDNVYAHLDWRQRVAGTAQPASGPALTLAADF